MAIKVYWACLEQEWLRAKKPEPVYESFVKSKKFYQTNIQYCPAFRQSLENVFQLRSIYDYNFSIVNESAFSDLYDQTFFNEHVLIRSMDEKCFSFQQYYVFITDDDSLHMTANMYPLLENNAITDNCIIFPGTYDIGRWYRNLEFGFALKNNCQKFEIRENDVYAYLKFHTDKKIDLIQYRHNEKLAELMKDCIWSREFKLKFKKLDEFYFMFKTKKMILNEIKRNVI